MHTHYMWVNRGKLILDFIIFFGPRNTYDIYWGEGGLLILWFFCFDAVSLSSKKLHTNYEKKEDCKN